MVILMNRIEELLCSKDEVLKFIREMEPHNHVILFYETEEDKRDALFTYLVSGIERGYAGAYVAGEDTPAQVRKYMKEYGIDVESRERGGALMIINYDGWCIKGGKVDPMYTINLWLKLFNEVKERGFKSLRACGEMTVFFKHNLIEDLLKYEEMLHRRLELAMMGLCAYNMRDFLGGRESLLLDLIKSHEYVIILGPRKALTIVKASV